MTTRVQVLGEDPYDVLIGTALEEQVVAALPLGSVRAAIFHAPVFAADAAALGQRIAETGRQVVAAELPDAEAAKTIEAATECWRLLGDRGFTRTDVVLSLGGGATTDVVGFVGATWLRGIDVVHVPTTLLAMVDAAVGGKTGINTSAGKNLVGAIHPPTAVICDLDRLASLSRADLAAGMAEVVKAGFIHDERILELVEEDPDVALDPRSHTLEELVCRAVQVKADVVADDLTEALDRELGRQVLNYGHTFAHAIEKVERYAWRHGDAVAVGMCFAAALSRAVGGLDDGGVERHRSVLASLGLPTRYRGASWDELEQAMHIDKKVRGTTIRFVVLHGIGQPALLAGPDPAILAAAFEEVS